MNVKQVIKHKFKLLLAKEVYQTNTKKNTVFWLLLNCSTTQNQSILNSITYQLTNNTTITTVHIPNLNTNLLLTIRFTVQHFVFQFQFNIPTQTNCGLENLFRKINIYMHTTSIHTSYVILYIFIIIYEKKDNKYTI